MSEGWTRVVLLESQANAFGLAQALDALAAGRPPECWDGHVADYLEALPVVQHANLHPEPAAHQLRVLSAAVLRRHLTQD